MVVREVADLSKQAKDSKDDALKASEAPKKAEAEAATSQLCRDAARALRSAAIANDDAKGQTAALDVFTHC